ncbi:MAG TPA: hypothetical protein VHC22_34400 [Pirellulales bacterium]|nr:hypothetical protein [Pirellulales bacterium]
MTSPHTLSSIAREANHLARNAGAGDSVVFQKIATVSMCVLAVASGAHVLMQLWRDLHREEKQAARSR